MPGMGGGGGTVQTSGQQNVNMGPWEPQVPYLGDVFSKAQTLYNTNQPNYFPTSTVAPMNSAQRGGYQSIIDRAGNNPLFPAAQGEYLKTVNGSYLDPNSNPYLKGTFDAASQAVSDQYKNITAPTTDALFASNGPISGGARQNAVDQNNAQLGRTLNNLATNIYGGNYQAERGRQYDAMGNVGSMIQAGYLDPTAAINAGGALQAQDQAELTDKVNRWMADSSKDAGWNQLYKYYGLIGGNNWGQNGTTYSTQQQPYQSSGAATGIGAGLGLLSLATPGAGGVSALGNIFSALPFVGSDRRLKTDIEKVGKDEDTGLDLYAYRYKGDPKSYPKVVGPMAQDIEKKYPDAVVDVGGRKAVSGDFMAQFFSPLDVVGSR